MVAPLWVLNTINICALRKSGPKFTKIVQGMLLHKTPNHAKFCDDRLKNAGDIRSGKFLLPETEDQSSPKFFRGCYRSNPLGEKH